MPLPTLSQVWFWAITVVCAGGGAYLGAYLKKKGENLATREDLANLVEQTRRLTQVTKEIEAKVDNQIWSRQRQWEMKRDALLAVVTALRKAHIAVSNLLSTQDMAMMPIDQRYKERIPEEKMICSEAMRNFNEKRFEASLVCSETVNVALTEANSLMNRGRRNLDEQEFGHANVLQKSIKTAVDSAIDAMRGELGFTSLSTESSAAPSPAE